MDTNKFIQSKIFTGFILGILTLIFCLLIFKAGMMVGMRKGSFSCRWNENYHRNFGGPMEDFFKDADNKKFIQANGTLGQIIKIDGSNSLVVKGQDGLEKVIIVNDLTTIKRGRDTIKLSDLKLDDYIVIIGEPNESGQIEAKFIRLMPLKVSFYPFLHGPTYN